MKALFRKCVTLWIVGTSVALVVCVGQDKVHTSSASYFFVVASGFLCDPGGSGSCAALAESPTGDSYEISGAGTFDAQNKSVKAAGTFSHKSTNGNVLETGVWIASELISFRSYGIAPAALMQKTSAFSRPQIGPKRPTVPQALPTGGLTVLRIIFLAINGATRTAILQLNCALGDVPRERPVDGFRLSFDGSAAEFREEAGGRVIFLRAPIGKPARTPQ